MLIWIENDCQIQKSDTVTILSQEYPKVTVMKISFINSIAITSLLEFQKTCMVVPKVQMPV